MRRTRSSISKLAELGPIGLIDHVLTPALALVVQHRSQGEISEEDEQFVLDVAAETVHQIAPAETAPATDAPLLMGVAARTAVDQVLVEMLCVGLADIHMEPAPADLSSEQAMQRVLDRKPASSLRSGDFADARLRTAQLLSNRAQRAARDQQFSSCGQRSLAQMSRSRRLA